MPFLTGRRARLNAIGVAVLLAGLGVGGFIAWHAPANTDDDALAALEQTKAYDLAMQRSVGPVGLLMNQWLDKAAELGQPRPLAIAILLVSGVAAGGLFLAARRRPD